MAVFIPLLVVLALGGAAYFGAQAGYQQLFGVLVPYVAVAIFVLGIVVKVFGWAKSPVPFRIPTTGGQQKSLDWVKSNPIDNPPNAGWAVVRMIFEITLFRSLFRNTQTAIHDGPRVTYSSSKWLWGFALLFHYAFLTIFIRHFRLFLEPVPLLIQGLEFFDGLFQIGVPRFYQTDAIIILAVSFLFLRRIFDDRVRYISLASDYFPLLLILGICLSGIWMRYFGKTDIASVKVMTMGLVSFKPVVVESVGAIFYLHLFLVSTLLIYFPFSKLMHLGGVFLSPTRNLPNDSRVKHHENPWNPPKKFHTYEAYEDDFRAPMVEAGLPVDKPLDEEETSEEKE
jgi:nitrate reductase gamma subunit